MENSNIQLNIKIITLLVLIENAFKVDVNFQISRFQLTLTLTSPKNKHFTLSLCICVYFIYVYRYTRLLFHKKTFVTSSCEVSVIPDFLQKLLSQNYRSFNHEKALN